MDTPFNMLIVGKTECGKTSYLLDMLERDYPEHFDYIFLICPTYSWNRTYQNWRFKDDPKFVPVTCDHDQADSFLSYVSKTFAGTNSLIVIDDCASGEAVKSRVSDLVRLAFSARHYGLSVVMITQKLTAVTSSYRENISKMVLFRTHSMKVWDTVMEEYLKILGVGKKELSDVIDKLMSNKYARLEIKLRHRRTTPSSFRTLNLMMRVGSRMLLFVPGLMICMFGYALYLYGRLLMAIDDSILKYGRISRRARGSERRRAGGGDPRSATVSCRQRKDQEHGAVPEEGHPETAGKDQGGIRPPADRGRRPASV